MDEHLCPRNVARLTKGSGSGQRAIIADSISGPSSGRIWHTKCTAVLLFTFPWARAAAAISSGSALHTCVWCWCVSPARCR